VREPVKDIARVLNEYVDAIVARTFAQQTLVELARYAAVPVINALSDEEHPCQALADLLTMHERFGRVHDLRIAYIGDGNNVARSLAVGCALVGVRFVLAAPDGYGFDRPFLEQYRTRFGNGTLALSSSPAQAVAEADVVYTDVWTSMGQEAEREDRLKAFAAYQVNRQLLSLTPKQAVVMHCLPARRGEEITDEVLDGDRSVVFQQAANRMHLQKALLLWLLGAV
jgi:ornithine carbamoyltransferase